MKKKDALEEREALELVLLLMIFLTDKRQNELVKELATEISRGLSRKQIDLAKSNVSRELEKMRNGELHDTP